MTVHCRRSWRGWCWRDFCCWCCCWTRRWPQQNCRTLFLFSSIHPPKSKPLLIWFEWYEYQTFSDDVEFRFERFSKGVCLERGTQWSSWNIWDMYWDMHKAWWMNLITARQTWWLTFEMAFVPASWRSFYLVRHQKASSQTDCALGIPVLRRTNFNTSSNAVKVYNVKLALSVFSDDDKVRSHCFLCFHEVTF